MTDSVLKRIKPFTLFSFFFSIVVLIAGFYPYPEVSKEIIIFIGRFHPLVVHMPIGFITAVIILQFVAICSKADLRLGIGTLLWFTMISGIMSAIIGTLLAIPGGYDEHLLQQHRQLGIGTSIACIWMLWAHRSKHKSSGLLYSLSLLATMGLVGATGHVGGSLTHGEDYLTAYLPESLGGKARPAPVDPGTKEDAAIYARVIQPILDAKCVSCHSEAKRKGELQMVSLEALLKGGKNGPSLIENNAAESLMIQRVHLPLDDKEHMPPEGKVQLSSAELELISWWIDRGAPKRMPLDTDLPADESIALIETSLGFAVAAPRLPMLSWEEVIEASRPFHNNTEVRIRRVSLESPALDVFFEPTTNSIDDLVGRLVPFKANITLLDIGNTVFTDAAIEHIAGFSNLEDLRLHNTPITDAQVAKLENLRQLRKINLYGSEITDAALDPLKKLPRLRQVNTYETKISFEAAENFVAEMENEAKQRKLESEILELKSKLNAMQVEVVGVAKSVVDFSIKVFDENREKYGERVAQLSRVTVSSASQFDPPGGLPALVHEKSLEKLAFAFHTAQEKNPWVRFSYEQPITLNAISVLNRADGSQDRASGLVLESYNGTPDILLDVKSDTSSTLKEYNLGTSLQGRYIVMRFTGPGTCNPGGTELVLGYSTAGNYRDKVLALNPSIYYTFDPADLVDADTAGSLGSLPKTATLSGGATFTGTTGGFAGGGLSIDDDSKQVLKVDGGPIDLNAEWTISVWFQELHPNHTWRTLIRSEGDGNDHQVIVQAKSDRLGIFNNDNADGLPNGFQDGKFDLAAGNKEWRHLAAVSTGGDAGQTDFYIDGKHVGTADQGGSGNIFAIGNYQGGGQPFAQTIDEFAVFDRALTASEITALSDNAAGPSKPAELTFLPDPATATASSEYDQNYVAGHLYDGTPTPADVGKADKLGRQYAGKGTGPHVVIYDMGKSVAFNRVFYAQRPHNACDRVNFIEFWVSDVDPGPASTTMPILEGTGWQEVWKFKGAKPEWHIDLADVPEEKRRARNFRLIVPSDSQYLHLKKVLMWAEKPVPRISTAKLDQNSLKYGERINSLARVSVSSTSQYDPPDGLKKLVQDDDNGLPFAFHTDHESGPWVQFSYDHETVLNGINIVNRRDSSQERARSIALESSKDGHVWEEIWKAKKDEKVWTIDLTGVAAEKRKGKYFRLILAGDATLHLAQVRLWGQTQKPRTGPDLFDKEHETFGKRINEPAIVTVSSTSPHDPPDGLKKLAQDKDNELPFAFHTEHELRPWVQFSYENSFKLNALSIRNRGNLQERADKLTLQSSRDGIIWRDIWTAPKIETVWDVDLTTFDEEARKGKYFRLIIMKDGPNILHLGQVRLWGTKLDEKETPVNRQTFDGDKAKYGPSIGGKAKVSFSTKDPNHHPENALDKITNENGSDLDFSFCTEMEKNPWIKVSFDHVIELNAMVIENRPNFKQRTMNLQVERLKKDGSWESLWRAPRGEDNWSLDFSGLPAEQRTSSQFRIRDTADDIMYLHLKHVRIWGRELEPVPVPSTVNGITGQGEWKYEVVPDWGKVPGHDHIGSTHGGIVIDQSGKVYVSTDGPNGMIVYNPDGSFIKTFGENSRRYHGLNIYQEDGKEYIYAAGMSHVAKFDLEGNVVMKIEGDKQDPANVWAKATAVAVAPNGDIFIADGYGSSVIFKYDRNGNFIKKFGLRGREAGQFITSHGLAMDARNPEKPLLLVCDRENLRLQHFDLDGNFVQVAINGLRRPCAVSIWKDYMLVAELAGRAVILDKNNTVISILGDNPVEAQRANFGVPPAQWVDGVFTAPHGCSFDAEGNIYIQDWNQFGRITKLVRKL